MSPSPTPGRFRQADAILDAALDLEGGERDAFVERACDGNAELLSAVRRLLRALDRSADFLSAPAADLARPFLGERTPASPGAVRDPPPDRIGPYRVIRELGRGGMGVVYLASRDDDPAAALIALKMLRGGALASGTTLRRFLAERRILATLEHPYIARLHGTGITPDGEPYFAMAYCAGSSLADRLASGAIPVQDALRIARQLAEALGSAHDKGIVHRDIKPANVLFNEAGEVQLTDFGVAKLMDQETTQSGMMMGTPAYLAPEQLRGLPIDHRADLWALGVTLYEMLTRRRPFDGPSYAAVMHAVLAVDPDPVGGEVAIPPAVDGLLRHLLRREPNARPESASDVARAIAGIEHNPAAAYGAGAARLPTPTPSPLRGAREASIVVVPFANTSGSPDDDPFIDGLTDEVISALGKVSGLRVTARTTAFALKRKGLDARTIATVVGVTYLLEGSVRRAGDRLKVSVQLVEAAQVSVIWSESYDRLIGDIFDVQEELARAIVSAFGPALGKAGLAPSPSQARGVASYELYLKGRYFGEKRSPTDLRRAADYFTRATEEDPSYAEAYAGLTDALILLMVLCGEPPSTALPAARAAMANALRLGTGLATVHATHGNLLSAFEWRWEESETELRQAITLDPGFINAWIYLAIGLQHLGRFDEAIDTATQALALDPLSPALNLTLGRAHLHAGRPAEALRPFRTAMEIAPGFPFAFQQLGHAYLQLGRESEGIEAFRKASAMGGRLEMGHLAYALALTGERSAASAIVDQLIHGKDSSYVPPFGVACAYAGLGDHDAALTWLHRGYDERAAQMNSIKVAPALVGLREDARFGALLARMNFPGAEP
jgi:serine/threonine protein kinase/tetratricopeptide (TPR) repeat protein